MRPEQLKEKLIQKSLRRVHHIAASRIQNWVRGRLNRKAFLEEVRTKVNRVKFIQRRWRQYKQRVLDPRNLIVAQERSALIIQKFMKGYRDSKRGLLMLLDARADRLYDEFHRIDIIMKGNLQRRVRRAWFKYKERKEEKARKKKEAAAKKRPYGMSKTMRKAPVAAPVKKPQPPPVKKEERKDEQNKEETGSQSSSQIPVSSFSSPQKLDHSRTINFEKNALSGVDDRSQLSLT